MEKAVRSMKRKMEVTRVRKLEEEITALAKKNRTLARVTNNLQALLLLKASIDGKLIAEKEQEIAEMQEKVAEGKKREEGVKKAEVEGLILQMQRENEEMRMRLEFESQEREKLRQDTEALQEVLRDATESGGERCRRLEVQALERRIEELESEALRREVLERENTTRSVIENHLQWEWEMASFREEAHDSRSRLRVAELRVAELEGMLEHAETENARLKLHAGLEQQLPQERNCTVKNSTVLIEEKESCIAPEIASTKLTEESHAAERNIPNLEEKENCAEKDNAKLEEEESRETEKNNTNLLEENHALKCEISAVVSRIRQMEQALRSMCEERTVLESQFALQTDRLEQTRAEALSLKQERETARAESQLQTAWLQKRENETHTLQIQKTQLEIEIAALAAKDKRFSATLRFMRAQVFALAQKTKALTEKNNVQAKILESTLAGNVQLASLLQAEKKKSIDLDAAITLLREETKKHKMVINDRGEEKREAIRQLCFALNLINDENRHLRLILDNVRQKLRDARIASKRN